MRRFQPFQLIGVLKGSAYNKVQGRMLSKDGIGSQVYGVKYGKEKMDGKGGSRA
ncbi:hypothetical protein [Dyadobacter tibetensis]|uniref:hypothetical protein n=1 Tax=Dyadobacter tibetensis TaxID=1211851 RepID=UPI0012FAA80A|nr:hypothetical protein [Dyadobacter tibetensis]